MYQDRIERFISQRNEVLMTVKTRKFNQDTLSSVEYEYLRKLDNQINALINKLERYALKKEGKIQDKVLSQVKELRELMD